MPALSTDPSTVRALKQADDFMQASDGGSRKLVLNDELALHVSLYEAVVRRLALWQDFLKVLRVRVVGACAHHEWINVRDDVSTVVVRADHGHELDGIDGYLELVFSGCHGRGRRRDDVKTVTVNACQLDRSTGI